MSDEQQDGRVAGIPWLRIVAEIAAIVFGILIAFAVDAEWERRKDLAEEQEILAGLEEDLQSSLDGLVGFWLPLHSGAFDASSRVLAAMLATSLPQYAWDWSAVDGALQGSREDTVFALAGDYWAALSEAVAERRADFGATVTLPDSLVGAALVTPTYDPNTASLTALLAENGLNRIRSREIRQQLSALPAQLADAADEELLARQHVDERLRPLLSLAGDMTLVNGVHWGWSEETAPNPRTLVTIQLSRELVGALAFRMPQLLGIIAELRLIALALEDTLELIRRERR